MARPEVTDRRFGDQFSEDNKPLVVSMAKAGALLDCGHDQIYDLIKAGELDSYIESNRRKVTMASIEALVAKRLAATGGKYQRGPHVPPFPPKGKKKKAAPNEGAAA
jgi:hypothetical protein